MLVIIIIRVTTGLPHDFHIIYTGNNAELPQDPSSLLDIARPLNAVYGLPANVIVMDEFVDDEEKKRIIFFTTKQLIKWMAHGDLTCDGSFVNMPHVVWEDFCSRNVRIPFNIAFSSD